MGAFQRLAAFEVQMHQVGKGAGGQMQALGRAALSYECGQPRQVAAPGREHSWGEGSHVRHIHALQVWKKSGYASNRQHHFKFATCRHQSRGMFTERKLDTTWKACTESHHLLFQESDVYLQRNPQVVL